MQTKIVCALLLLTSIVLPALQAGDAATSAAASSAAAGSDTASGTVYSATDRLERPLAHAGSITIENSTTEAISGEYWLPGIMQCTQPAPIYNINFGPGKEGFKCFNFDLTSDMISFDLYQDERTGSTGELHIKSGNGYMKRIPNPTAGHWEIYIMNNDMYWYEKPVKRGRTSSAY